jgi:Cu-Zn family superoxide dismutase
MLSSSAAAPHRAPRSTSTINDHARDPTMSDRSLRIAAALAIVLAACGSDAIATDDAPSATVRLQNAAAAEIGTARFTEDAAGRVQLTVEVRGMTPGAHGLHLHAVGSCVAGTATAFSSAGGHFNPAAREHGHANPRGHHAGDLPNVVVDASGTGRLRTTLTQFTLAALADADGTALVIHQNEDDGRTDTGPLGPGNSGPRIGCGVLTAD